MRQPGMMNRLPLATLLAVALTLVCALGVMAAPPPPAVYWGFVTVNGADVPAGTSIISFVYDVDGVTPITCGSTTSLISEGDAVYSIAVNGDDSESAGKDGAEDGDTVYFWIGTGEDRRQADQTGEWHEASTNRLDLSAEDATPTPTATPTATPTVPPTNSPVFLPLIQKANMGGGQYMLETYQVGSAGYDGATDTYLDGWNPQTNYGAAERLSLSAYEVRSSVLYFDLSDIPQTVRVESARIELNAAERSVSQALPVALYRVNRHWSEDGANYLSANGEEWEIAGCSGATDRDAAHLSTAELSKTAWWYSWDITSLVRDWVHTPTSNAGLLLVGSSEAGQPSVQYDLHSSESPDVQKRPKLTVAYWLPAN